MNETVMVGDKAQDKVTQIQGIVVVRHDYLYGCARIGIQPEGSHSGKPHDVLHIDLPQAILIQKNAVDRSEFQVIETIPLGSEASDKITGFAGVCMGRAEWLYSCTKVLLVPRKLVKEKPAEGVWFDEPQIELIKAKVIEEKQKNTGGPCPSVSHHNSVSSR